MSFVPPTPEPQICFVNCGKPLDKCECWRSAHRDLLKGQMPLPTDFAKVWDDHIDDLYIDSSESAP